MSKALIHDRVELEIKDQIAFVKLTRSDKLNALDMPMFEAIIKAAKTVSKNKEIRGVILSGEGRAFCSGLDVKSMLKNPMAAIKLLIKPGTKFSNIAQDVSYLWREVPVPVIAVTHGKCWGGGFQIALGADFRYAQTDCTFSIMETKWGLIPDMAGSIALRELLPIDRAKELTMTSEVFDAQTARNYNLVTRVCEDPMQEAIEFLNALKQKSPDAISYTKKLYNSAWLSTIRQALNLETKLQRKLIGRYNQKISGAVHAGEKSHEEYKERG